jgi:hypothetical protein
VQRIKVMGVAALATTVVTGISVVAPGGTAAAASHPQVRGHARVGLHYGVNTPLCGRHAKPGAATCFGVRHVETSRNHPGAKPFTVDASYPTAPDGFGLTPGDLATAYDFDPESAFGATQTVAIVDAYDDPNILTDLNAFDTYYGIKADGVNVGESATSFVKVGQTGSTTVLPPADTSGWSGEEALDVEAVRGVCHHCNIILVEAKDAFDTNLVKGVAAAVKLGATEVSNSYGGPEGKAKNFPKHARKLYAKFYNYPGVVITASTGDDGWFSWDYTNLLNGSTSAESPNLPSSLPHVVAVGGTSLKLTASATRKSETVWNFNGPGNARGVATGQNLGATGGGCSVLYKASGWQRGIGGFTKTGCGKQRLAADISADGDPQTGYGVYDSYDCGPACEPLPTNFWGTIGGTSLSSPVIAAMWALAGGSGGVDYPSMSLYGHINKAKSSMYDIVKGGNSWCAGQGHAACAKGVGRLVGAPKWSPNDLEVGNTYLGTLDCGFKPRSKSVAAVTNNRQCYAASGYDGPSGLGAPIGLSEFRPLSVFAAIKHGKAVAKSKTAFSIGGGDPFPGATWAKGHWNFGDGTSSGGTHPKHVYKKPGTYTVTLKATDSYGNVSTVTGKVKVKVKS